MTTRILLVDGDVWMQRVVMSALRHEDYTIDTAEDGHAALTHALQHPPSLFISDVLMPRMNGWRLIRRLRAQRQFATTPFIFLTALATPESRRHSYRLGADDFLPKPACPRELVVRVQRALRRTQPARAARDRDGRLAPLYGRGLSGALEDITLPTLLVLLEMERKHGLLILTNCDTGERCRVFLRDGRIVGAALDGARGDLGDTELLYRVLAWSKGAFEFKALPVEMHDEIQATTTHLLLEASRRLDEQTRGSAPARDNPHASGAHTLHISFSDRLANVFAGDGLAEDSP